MKETRTIFTCDVCQKEAVGKELPHDWFRVASDGGYIKYHICGTECLSTIAVQFQNAEKQEAGSEEEAT